MENLTIVGMKELSNRVFKIERSLESIAKSLETLVKIQNKQIPKPINWMPLPLEQMEDEDEV